MIDSSPAKRLREERLRLGLTQAEAAAICGVERETWSRYESGKLAPGMDVLAALAMKGADIALVLTGSEGGVLRLTAREQVLLDYYRHIGDTNQRTVDAMVAALAAGAPPPFAPKAQVTVHGKIGQQITGDGTFHNYMGGASSKRRKK